MSLRDTLGALRRQEMLAAREALTCAKEQERKLKSKLVCVQLDRNTRIWAMPSGITYISGRLRGHATNKRGGTDVD